MTGEEHRQRHLELHQALDELLADYLMHHPGKLLSATTLEDLLRWSHAQTVQPVERATRSLVALARKTGQL